MTPPLQAIERARAHPLSYAVRILESPDGRRLTVVGEAHMKLRTAAEIGRELVNAFELRGVETFPARRVLAGRLLKILIYAPRLLLRILTLGAVKGSTITEAVKAPNGTTFLLESVSEIPLALHVGSLYLALFFSVLFALLLLLHLPFAPPRLVEVLLVAANVLDWHLVALIPAYLLRRQRWSWLLHPMIAILTVRNQTMAEGTVVMLREHPSDALIIMGRAHVPGYAQLLVEKYGFKPVDPL